MANPNPNAAGRIGAIVQHFYAGALGGEALAEVLFGVTAPSGRLPVMVPQSEDQLPKDYLDQSMVAPPGRTHRYFQGTPLYPFGFGLGYSTFGYSRLIVSHHTLAAGAADLAAQIRISVDVTNNGEYEGAPSDEVVMAFVTPTLHTAPTVTMAVPRQLLLGFSRAVVPPGRTVQVSRYEKQ